MKYIALVYPLFLIGCSLNSAVTVVRPDAQAGTFTVIPSDDSPRETVFAGKAEKTLMNLGLAVAERPSFRFLPSGSDKPFKPVAKQGAQNLHEVGEVSIPREEKAERVVDVPSMYADVKADYIAVTYAGLPGAFRRIRILKKDGTLVATVDYPYDHDEEIGVNNPSPLYTSLASAGIIKGKAEVLQCGYALPPKPAKPAN